MLIRIATACTLAMALIAPALHAGTHTDFHKAAQVSNLMSRVKSNAVDIREQAGRLRSYNRTPDLYSWELHADELNRVRGELDRLAGLIKDLKALEPNMTLRQSAAFNQVVTSSAKASDAAQNAIKILNTHKEKLRVASPDYEKAVNGIYDNADEIAAHADTVEAWSDLIQDLKDASDD
ncbi:MAG: hypothetical protein GC160_26290 [Acidobacteria bacterium]|nr:hypothetical protein [Acidobacteriota bacterium]